MKITDVQAHVLAIPMAPGKQKMPWTWGNFNQVIISVHYRGRADRIRRGVRVRGCRKGHRLGGGRKFSSPLLVRRRRHADHHPAGPHVPAHAPVRPLRGD